MQKTYIRSTQHSLKFTNKDKRKELNVFISQYRNMVKKFINIIWNNKQLGKNTKLPSLLCNSINTGMTVDSRIRQCAAKQALSMVKAATKKRDKRLFMLKKLKTENKPYKHLEVKLSKTPLVKPNCDNINVELDSRFVHFQFNSSIMFDLFIRVKEIGNKRNIYIPLKLTKPSNKWSKLGTLGKSIRLNKDCITLFFKINKNINSSILIVGGDPGILTVLSLGNKKLNYIQTTKGNELEIAVKKLSKKKTGSKSYNKNIKECDNIVHRQINKLDFAKINTVNLEKTPYNYGSNPGKLISCWRPSCITDKMISKSQEEGFNLALKDSPFMSQRCSTCGWTHRTNRKGKTFTCKHCRYTVDSDVNSSFNHSLVLYKIPYEVWSNRKKLLSKGFFWKDNIYTESHELIVRDVQKT